MEVYLYAALAAFVVVGIAGLALWMTGREGRARGRAEAEAEHNERMAQNAEAQGRVIAEHREPEDAARRLDRGDF